MEIILVIAVICIFFYLSSRISRLEKLIKSGGAKVSSVGSPEPVISEASRPAAPVRQTIPVETSRSSVSSEEMSGKILGRIGIGAVIVGVAFFLKYAFDNNWVGPEGRVVIGIIIGLGLLGIGQWLRKKYMGYSDLLMGGGLAVLYLSVYSSYALYHIVDPMLAFMGMAAITAVGVTMSIMNATQTLSAVAIVGGFATPALIGVSLIGPWVTFTYITILNAGIIGILTYKKWESLIIIGLAGTWLHFGGWLMFHYTQDLLVPTLFFILVQYLIFTSASIIRLIIEKLKATELDYILLSITALSFAGACYWLLMPTYKDYTAVGAVGVAILYGVIALIAFKENPEDRTLNIFLPGLAVSFLTAAIAIEFTGPWVAAWWFVESIVLYIVASKSSSRGFQVMGVIVYILGLLKLFNYVTTFGMPVGYVIFFNGPFIMECFAILVAYVISFVYYTYGSVSTDIQKRGISVFVIMANVLTVYALTSQITAYYLLQESLTQFSSQSNFILQNSSNTSVSILWALYAALLTVIGFARKISVVRRMGLFLFLITAVKVVIDVWNLGELYRIISFVAFGIIALTASFMYVKYKHRLKEVI